MKKKAPARKRIKKVQVKIPINVIQPYISNAVQEIENPRGAQVSVAVVHAGSPVVVPIPPSAWRKFLTLMGH